MQRGGIAHNEVAEILGVAIAAFDRSGDRHLAFGAAPRPRRRALVALRPWRGEAWRQASRRCDRTRSRAASATARRRCRCNGWPSDRRPGTGSRATAWFGAGGCWRRPRLADGNGRTRSCASWSSAATRGRGRRRDTGSRSAIGRRRAAGRRRRRRGTGAGRGRLAGISVMGRFHVQNVMRTFHHPISRTQCLVSLEPCA